MWRFAVIICCVVPFGLHAQSNDSQIRVLVTAPENVAVADLTIADIQLEQDGRPANVGTPVILQRVPLWIGIVFDESGSGRGSALHDLLLQKVLDWVAPTLARYGGDAFLVGFNDQIITSTEIVTDVSELRRALSQLHPIGGSAVRDSIIHSMQKFYALGPESRPTARMVVFVSDGLDNASSAKERNAIESALWFGVRVYTIAFPLPKLRWARPSSSASPNERVGKRSSPATKTT